MTLSPPRPRQGLVEYGLREISYEARSGTCHELKVLARPDEPLLFHFEDEREAQAWWAAVSSSLREVQKGQPPAGAPSPRPPGAPPAPGGGIPGRTGEAPQDLGLCLLSRPKENSLPPQRFLSPAPEGSNGLTGRPPAQPLATPAALPLETAKKGWCAPLPDCHLSLVGCQIVQDN